MRTNYDQLATPAFVVDRVSVDYDYGHNIDWSAVGDEFRTTGQVTSTVQMAAGAAAGATSLTVDPLPAPITSGTVLDFTGAGEFARVTADAAQGATTVTVEALDAAIEDNDTATYVSTAGTGDKVLPAGTRMSLAADGFRMVPTATAGTNAIGLLATAAIEKSEAAALSGYGLIVGGVIYENLLPGATGTPAVIAAAHKTGLAANGTGFSFKQYRDSRGE